MNSIIKILVTFIFLFPLIFFSQESYQVKYSQNDRHIDWMKGYRNYTIYVEQDVDTRQMINETRVKYTIYVNYSRTYSNDTVGEGMITIYTGSQTIKLPFNEVYHYQDMFHFYYNDVLFAYYLPQAKTFSIIDRNKRVFKNLVSLD